MKLRYFHEFITEELNAEQRQNEILDKISKSGIESLTKGEMSFLDAHSKSEEDIEQAHQDLFREDDVIEDDYFRFKFEDKEDYEGDTMIHGEMSVKFNKEEFYGKFVFNESGMLQYYMFIPTGSPGGTGTGAETESYFDDIVDDYALQDELFDLSQKVKARYVH